MAGLPDREAARRSGRRRWGARLLWFVALWAAGFGSVTLLAFIIRSALL